MRESYRSVEEAEAARDRWQKRGCYAYIERHDNKTVVVINRLDLKDDELVM